MSLYTELKYHDIPMSNHYSDLYFQESPESVAILNQFPLEKSNSTRFEHQQNGEQWIDVPFAFVPYWEEKQKRC